MLDMKKLFLLITLSSILLGSKAQKTDSVYYFTLEQCLEYAFQNSYNRQNMVLDEEINQIAYKYSKQERLPSLSASLSEGFSHTGSESGTFNGNLGLNTGITIFQGGTINNTIKQNKLLSEQSFNRTEQFDNELTIQILQSFLTVLGYEELLKYQKQVLTSSEEQLIQGEHLYKAGSILESDYLLLQAQYANDKNSIVDGEINKANSLLALKMLLSMDPLSELEIIYPDTSAIDKMLDLPSKDSVLEQAMSTLPNIKIAEQNIEMAKLNVKLSKASYYPSIDLSAGIGTGHIDFSGFGKQLEERFSQQVTLSLNVPIYNRGKTKSRVRQNEIALRQAELDYQNTDLNMRQTIVQEYQNVESAFSKYEATKVRENAYSKTYEAYRHRYMLGDVTPVDLLQQQNNYISALNDYIQAKYGFILKRKMLDVYMGLEIKM